MRKSNLEVMDLELRSALLGTGLVQPVDSKVHPAGAKATSSIQILSRQVPGQEAAWLEVVDQLLALEETLPVSLHVCRRYLRKNGKMVYGWHLGLSGTMSELEALSAAIVPVLAAARPSLDAPAAPARSRAARPPPEAPQEAPEAPPEPRQAARSRPLAPGQRPPPREAPPREPGAPAAGVEAPEGFIPTLRVTKREIGDDGKERIEETMPLPHVYREMSRPRPGSKRGAYKQGDSSYHPTK